MAKQAVIAKGDREGQLSNQERERRRRVWLAATKVLKAAAIRTGVPDLGLEHEHYLYGRPKQGAGELR
jgi:hypothetical protein